MMGENNNPSINTKCKDSANTKCYPYDRLAPTNDPKSCPECSGDMRIDTYNDKVFLRECYWCGFWDRGECGHEAKVE